MKKNLLFLLSVMVAMTAFADSRSTQQMLAIAQQKLGTNVTLVSGQNGPAKVKGVEATEAYAVYNAANGRGFAIIGADDRLPEVIGYSNSGSFDDASIAPQLKELLASLSQRLARKTARYEATDRTFVPVDTLITTLWSQDAPYSNQCPLYGKDRACTGCVATALAQVINYWGQKQLFPVQGKEKITWYSSDEHNKDNFGNVTVDLTLPLQFDLMLDEYIEGQYTYEQGDAVAYLMSVCGALSQMNYGVEESGGEMVYLDKIEYNYEFAPGSKLVGRMFYTEDEWKDMVWDELEQARPILYSAFKGFEVSGHAFVLDGLDEEGNVHVNWGWEGTSNGYFSLDLMDPDSEGIGGSEAKEGYVHNPEMVLYFTPDARTPDSEYSCKSIFFDTETQKVIINGLSAFSHCRKAGLAFRLENKETEEADTIVYNMPNADNCIFASKLSPAGDFTEDRVEVAPDFSDIDDGTYLMTLLSLDPGEKGWSLIRTPSNVYQCSELVIEDHKVTKCMEDDYDITQLEVTLENGSTDPMASGRTAYIHNTVTNNTGFDFNNATFYVKYVDADNADFDDDDFFYEDKCKEIGIQEIKMYLKDLNDGETYEADLTCTFPSGGKYVLLVGCQMPNEAYSIIYRKTIEVEEGHTADFYDSFAKSDLTAPETVELGQSFEITLTYTPLIDKTASVKIGVFDNDDNNISENDFPVDFIYKKENVLILEVPDDAITEPGTYYYGAEWKQGEDVYYFGSEEPDAYTDHVITVVDGTGIKEVTSDVSTTEAYDLLGRRVNPLSYKGIIIQNGRKHLNK